MLPRFHLKGRWVFAVSLCFVLAACDSQPDVRLLIHPPQPLAQDCLEKLPGFLVPQMPVAEVRRPRPNPGAEYEVRGTESQVSVFQDFKTNAIELASTSQGSGSPSLALLKNVRGGVLKACDLDPGKIQVERSCTGDACKDPQYPGL